MKMTFINQINQMYTLMALLGSGWSNADPYIGDSKSPIEFLNARIKSLTNLPILSSPMLSSSLNPKSVARMSHMTVKNAMKSSIISMKNHTSYKVWMNCKCTLLKNLNYLMNYYNLIEESKMTATLRITNNGFISCKSVLSLILKPLTSILRYKKQKKVMIQNHSNMLLDSRYSVQKSPLYAYDIACINSMMT